MVSRFVQTMNNVVWGFPMVILLLGTHIFFTIRTGLIQKKIIRAISLLRKNEDGRVGTMRPKQVFSAVVASMLGTGNITGLGAAIVVGGPGALFWFWLTGILGMATKYGESLLAVKFRVQDQNGTIKGGPMYVMERGLNKKWMGKWYAAIGAVVSFGIGGAIQVCSVANVVDVDIRMALIGTDNFFTEIVEQWPWITKIIVGVLAALLTAIVILGGVKSITGLCNKILPWIGIFYMAGCVLILIVNRTWIFEACSVILECAFQNTRAAAGIGVAKVIRCGTMRGMFSNEAGLGISGILEANTKSSNPASQGIVSALGTFIDTAVMGFLTGLVMMTSILKSGIALRGVSETEIIINIFERSTNLERSFFVIAIMAFAYTTMLGWSYYGEQCAEYLFGKKVRDIYHILWIAVLAVAPIFQIQLLREAADCLNGLLAIPNLITLWLLNSVVGQETKDYKDHPDKRENGILKDREEEKNHSMYI